MVHVGTGVTFKYNGKNRNCNVLIVICVTIKFPAVVSPIAFLTIVLSNCFM